MLSNRVIQVGRACPQRAVSEPDGRFCGALRTGAPYLQTSIVRKTEVHVVTLSKIFFRERLWLRMAPMLTPLSSSKPVQRA